MLLIPAWFLLFMALATGIALFSSALMVGYRDVQYVVPFVLQLFLYASPIAYSVNNLPQKYHLFYELNPIASLLADMRWSLFSTLPHHQVPSGGQLALSILAPLVVLLAGATFFEQLERGFADVI